jgi:hypothetical protein
MELGRQEKSGEKYNGNGSDDHTFLTIINSSEASAKKAFR